MNGFIRFMSEAKLSDFRGKRLFDLTGIVCLNDVADNLIYKLDLVNSRRYWQVEVLTLAAFEVICFHAEGWTCADDCAIRVEFLDEIKQKKSRISFCRVCPAICDGRAFKDMDDQTSTAHILQTGISLTHKIDNIGILVNFVFPNISSFLPYLHHMWGNDEHKSHRQQCKLLFPKIDILWAPVAKELYLFVSIDLLFPFRLFLISLYIHVPDFLNCSAENRNF